MNRPRRSRVLLGAALLALAALFAFRFHDSEQLTAALIVFVLPPLLLLAGVLRGSARAAFWAGVCGLLWFSHGVMEAWSEPALRLAAWAEILLALVVIAASSWPGLSARFGRRRPSDRPPPP
ncbi:DUF2069 domain-containing protein [Luteimonas suaedae]|uniref:DUF2069 domain-containing protein n=1 Tax=Luteimonas suaedae TaxID=2605430 RepID=UPI0011F026BA|nr:DUF2069 domain-containing protein [Luteimonas suaedae]